MGGLWRGAWPVVLLALALGAVWCVAFVVWPVVGR